MMNIKLLHKEIKSYLLTKGLPGEKAQALMAPSSRNPKLANHSKSPTPSAVLLLIYPKDEQWHLALIKRNSYKGSHSAQISLPGGKVDKADAHLLECALRETYEEIGFQSKEDDIIGELSSLYIPISNFMVHPFVAIIDHTPQFIPDTHEVKHIIEIPLNVLLDPKHLGTKELTSQEHSITAPTYQLEDDYIWGATAMILSEFAEILKQLNTSTSD